jgi:hypothetical protein
VMCNFIFLFVFVGVAQRARLLVASTCFFVDRVSFSLR